MRSLLYCSARPTPPLPPRFFRDALDDQGRRFPYPLAFYLPALLPRPRQLDFLLAYELASRAAAQAPPAALNRSAADCLDAETATVRRDFVEFTAAAAALRMTSPTSPAFPAARREFFVSVSQLYCQKAVPGHRWGRAGPLPDRVGRLLARLPGFADAFNCLGDGRRVCRPGSRGQRLPGLLTCGPAGPTAQFEFPYKLSEDLRALRVGGGRGGPGDRSADEPVFLKQCPDKTCIEMFKDTFQSGFLSVLYSIGSKPLQIWTKQVRNGHIKRITDNDIQSLVLEIVGTNVSTTYITCPAESDKTLGIKLPFLVMIIKNLKKYFTFEVQILDDKNVRRRFRASNYQSTTRVKPFICTMPMRLDEGWNQIQFNLSDFTRRAYGTNYIETLRIQIHANCRIRRVYFSDRLYTEDELPAEFKLFLPVGGQKSGDKLPAATQQQAKIKNNNRTGENADQSALLLTIADVALQAVQPVKDGLQLLLMLQLAVHRVSGGGGGSLTLANPLSGIGDELQLLLLASLGSLQPLPGVQQLQVQLRELGFVVSGWRRLLLQLLLLLPLPADTELTPMRTRGCCCCCCPAAVEDVAEAVDAADAFVDVEVDVADACCWRCGGRGHLDSQLTVPLLVDQFVGAVADLLADVIGRQRRAAGRRRSGDRHFLLVLLSSLVIVNADFIVGLDIVGAFSCFNISSGSGFAAGRGWAGLQGGQVAGAGLLIRGIEKLHRGRRGAAALIAAAAAVVTAALAASSTRCQSSWTLAGEHFAAAAAWAAVAAGGSGGGGGGRDSVGGGGR
uniref:DUF667 domain-containing protein n=1 Tax=Macrostomum lignano TaxID=282301 RepID=A0A1I8HWY4_9PLAT